MSILNPQFQALIYGDRSAFAFIPESNTNIDITPIAVTAFLSNAAEKGYTFTNADILFNLSPDGFIQFKEEFTTLINSFQKEGMILRKSFGESTELTPYTDEDWRAILAQYSITYGWADFYKSRFSQDPVAVLGAYVGSMPKHIVELSTNTKEVTIWRSTQIRNFIRNILESKSVLRTQQIQVLKTCNTAALANIAGDSHITIKETLASVANLLIHTTLTKPILKSSTDVLRFITTNYVAEPIEGQITKVALKTAKMKIPTSVRKFLLTNLELLARDRGEKYLTEDMFQYSAFWKRIDKYLRFTKVRIMRKRYPMYTDAIDLLYEDDRSWTFNGRYSAAKESLDYASAIVIAAEKPGFLLRNLLEFMRMKTGTPMPVKEKIGATRVLRNPMTEALGENTFKDPNTKVVKTNAFAFIQSDQFKQILRDKGNPKLLFQMFEMLNDAAIYLPTTTRMIQGIEVHYSTPLPGVDKQLGKYVLRQIVAGLTSKLNPRNENLGKVYFPNLGYKIQYSGRKSTELSLSGSFLPPGTELSIADLYNESDKLQPILRLGIMWRGKGQHTSVDLDHSVLADNHAVFYGSPQYKGRKTGNICITSSGDITTSSKQKFSVELVDIDILECFNNNIEEIIQSVVVYSGRTNIGDYEAYFFFSVIDASERLVGNRVTMSLDKADYAIQIDPENKTCTGAQLGVRINVKKGIIEVLNIPIDTTGRGSSVITNKNRFQDALDSFVDDRMPLTTALEIAVSPTQRVHTPEEADTIISTESRDELGITDEVTLLHPGRDMETIQTMLF